MANKDAEKKMLATLALLNKAMEQIDVLISIDKDARYTKWKNNLYTVSEDIGDKITEENL